MALLDFIRNRQQQSTEQQAQPKPETAREMYANQAEQGQTGQRSVSQLSEADKTQARELGSRLDAATQQSRQNDRSAAPPTTGDAGSPEPMRQNMMSQDKPAPDLSPTSAQHGAVAHEQEAPQNSPTESQRPQTIAWPTPSWER